MRLLELFSGTHSVGNAVACIGGWVVVSLDVDAQSSPSITTDILEWDYKAEFPRGHFDVIWCSPPCERFSVLRRTWIGRKLKAFGDVPVTAEMLDDDMVRNGLPILRRAEEIIEYFQPNFYFIENPRTGKMKDYLKHRPHYDVDYCQYGFGYQKKTRIWTNLNGFGARCCSRGCSQLVDGKHPNSIGGVTRGNVFQQGKKYAIPPRLVEELFGFVPNR